MTQSHRNDFSFYSAFLRLAGINILSNLMVPLASLIDLAFLGHLSDLKYLAGVAIATVLFNVLYWSFGFLRMGTTGMTAQALGRQDEAEIQQILIRNGCVAIAIALFLLLLQTPLRHIGFTLLSATPNVKQTGQAYYDAMIWGAPANLLGFVLLGWFLGQGRGFAVLLMSMVGNGSNVGLNYYFIVQLGWASAGAGWATALSQTAATLTGIFLLLPLLPKQSWAKSWAMLRDSLLNWSAMQATLKLNGNIMIRTLALLAAFSLFTNFSSALGMTILSANTLLLNTLSFSAYFIDGIAFATESFAGQFYGQEQPQHLKPLLMVAGSFSVILGLLFSLGAIAFTDPIFALLTSHQTVLQQVHDHVIWLLPVLGMGGLAYMLDGYFLGLSKGSILRNSAILSTALGFLPVALWAHHQRNAQMLWLALALYMTARVITLLRHVPTTLKAIAHRYPPL